MKNTIIVIGLFVAVGLTYLLEVQSTNEGVKTTTLNEQLSESDSSVLTLPKDPPLAIKKVEALTASSSTSTALHSQEEVEDLFFSQFKHLTANSFSNSDQLTSAYLNENGSVSRAALDDTFNVGNFNELIERVKSIEQSESAAFRESTLADKLINLAGVNIYSENYSCAGKICTVSFDFEGKDEDVEELSKFSKNYSFKNIVEDEYGYKKFKAIYIETDDPSRLSLGI